VRELRYEDNNIAYNERICGFEIRKPITAGFELATFDLRGENFTGKLKPGIRIIQPTTKGTMESLKFHNSIIKL
jgi:hypothetical protein